MGLATIHSHSQKEHTEIHKIHKFGVNQASFHWDTAIWKCQNLQRNVWQSGRCFTHTIYNATLTLPTLHALIKILTHIVTLQCLTFTDLVLFKFVKKKKPITFTTYIAILTSLFTILGTHTHTYIHVPVNYPTLRLEALHLSNRGT